MSPPRYKLQDSPQPLYVQIKDVLKQRILDGVYQPHEKLASENELMAAFGVSRITVRQALRDLHNEGLVFSSQGKGTFVSKPMATQDLQSLQGFEEAMAAKGYATASKLVHAERRRTPKAVRSALRLAASDDVFEVRRVRYLNRDPVSIDVSYFPLDVGTRLAGRNLERDIFPLLENELGIPLGAADLRIGAALPDEATRKLLRLSEGEPVLRVERLTYDANDRPIDFEYLFIRADAYQYQFRIERRKRK
jgi:GntR family transcriptional regulator